MTATEIDMSEVEAFGETDAGFAPIHVHTVPGDPVNNYYVCHETA